jgi:ribonuclease P protein component
VNFPFPKSARLLTRGQFQRMSRPERRVRAGPILIDISSNKNKKTRLGITVTRRYGKSHDRNRFKRLVREAFRFCLPLLPQGIDLVVKPRQEGEILTLEAIIKGLTMLIAEKESGERIR